MDRLAESRTPELPGRPTALITAEPTTGQASPIQDRPQTLETTLGWVLQARGRLNGHPEADESFMKVFQDYISRVVTALEAADRWSVILRSHRDLIEGLNSFLPSACHIDIGRLPTSITSISQSSVAITIWCPCHYSGDREDSCPVCLNPIGPSKFITRNGCCRMVTHAECLSRCARTAPYGDVTPRNLFWTSCPHCNRLMQRQKIIEEVELRKQCGQSSFDVHPKRQIPPASAAERVAALILTEIKSDPTLQGGAHTQAEAERLANRVDRIEAANVRRDSRMQMYEQALQRAGLVLPPSAPTNAASQQQQANVSDYLTEMGDEQSNRSDEQTVVGDEQPEMRYTMPIMHLPNDSRSQSTAHQAPTNGDHRGIIAPVSILPPLDMPLFGDGSQRDFDRQSSFMDHIDPRQDRAQG